MARPEILEIACTRRTGLRSTKRLQCAQRAAIHHSSGKNQQFSFQ
jgi:hypothetical protein